MSLKTSQRVWQDTALKGSEKLMALALAELSDDDGFCWYGYDKLAEMAGVKTRQAMNLVNALKDSGAVIVWEQQGQHGGRGYTNIYLVVCGLTDDEIGEIVSRRFAASPAETIAILSKTGDLYIELCHLKRVHCSTLEKTRKGAMYDTQPEKRVQSSTQKGATHYTRSINNPLSNNNLDTRVREEISQLTAHFVEQSKLDPPIGRANREKWDKAFECYLGKVGGDVARCKELITKAVETMGNAYPIIDAYSIERTYNGIVAQAKRGAPKRQPVSKNGAKNGTHHSRTGPKPTRPQGKGRRVADIIGDLPVSNN